MDQQTNHFEKLRLENELLKERLLKSEEKYRALYEENPSMYFTVDARGTVISVNSFGAKQIGYETEELIGKSVLMVFHPEDHGIVTDHLKKCLQDPENVYRWDSRKIRKDFSVILARESACVVAGGEGIRSISIAGEEITKRKQAEIDSESRDRRQQVLVELGRLALAGSDVSVLMNEAVSVVAKTLGVEYAKVLELQPDQNSLLLRAGVGWKDGLVGHESVSAGTQSQAGFTLISNEPVIVDNFSRETRFTPPPLLKDHSVASGISTVIHGKEKPYGVLGAHTVSKRTYTRDEAHFVQSVGNVISEAIERSIVEDDLRITNAILQAVNESSELSEVFDIAIDRVMRLTDIDIVGIYLVDESTKEAVLEGFRGYPDNYLEKARRIPYPKGVTWRVINSCEIYVVQDVSTDPYIGPVGKESGFQSILSVPVKIGDRAIGVIHFHSSKKNKFGKREVDLFSSIGTQIALAVSKAKQTKDIKLINEDLSALNLIATSVHESLELAAVLNIALDKVVGITAFDIIAIYLVDEDTNEAVLKAYRGLTEEYVSRAGRIPYARGITWKFINSGESSFIEDVQEDTDLGPAGRVLGHRSVLAVPMKQEHMDRAAGVVIFASRKVLKLSSRDVNLLNAIGNQIGTAIVHSSLYERSKKQAQELMELNKDLDERTRDLEVINAVNQVVHGSIDLQEVYKIALDMVIELENVDMAMIYLVDEHTNEAILQAHRNVPEDYLRRASRIPYPRGITWKVISTGLVTNIEDAQKDPDIGPAGRDLGHHSILGVPISHDGKGRGVVWFLSYKERMFNNRELSLLSNIGSQIATAVAKARLFESEITHREQIEAVHEISQAISSELDYSSVLHKIGEHALRFAQGKFALVSVNEGNGIIRTMAVAGEDESYATDLHQVIDIERDTPYECPNFKKCIHTGSPVVVSDVANEFKTKFWREELTKRGINSMVAVPLVYKGTSTGVLALYSTEPRAYDQARLELLLSFANQAAVAIENARLYQEINMQKHQLVSLYSDLDERSKKLEILNTISQAVHKSFGLQEVYDIALDSVIALENVDLCCIYILDEGKKEAVMQAHRKFPDAFIEKAGRIPYPKGVTWKVLSTGEIVNVKNATEHPDIGPAGKDLGFRSMLGIPVAVEGKPLGVLWLLSYLEHEFSKTEEEMLTSIGRQIAIAVAKAKLYRELEKKTSYEKIIRIVTQNVHQSLFLPDVLENVVEALFVNLDHADWVEVYLVEGEQAVLKAHRGYEEDYLSAATAIPFPKGFTWRTMIEGKPRYCPDVDCDDAIGPAGIKQGIKSYLALPIKFENITIGTLAINSSAKDAFSKEELELLNIVASQLETAISNAKKAEALNRSERALRENLAQLSKKNRYERIVSTITQSVHQSINLQDVLDNAVEAMQANIQGCHNVSIYMVDGREAVMKANKGYPEWFIETVGRIPYPKGFTWKTIIDGKPIYVSNTENDKVIGPAGLKVGTKSYAAMPIRFEGKTIGAININSFKLDAFDDEDLKLLEIVAQQIELAINNAKHAEALRESEQRYRNLVETARDIIFTVSPDGAFTSINLVAESITGWSLDEWIGKHFAPIIHPDDLPRAMELFTGVMKGEVPDIFEMRIRNRSGEFLTVESIVTPQIKNGMVVGGLGISRDITERKKIEQALRKSEERSNYIFDNMPNVAIQVYDIEGKVVYWNKAAEKIFGWSKEQAVGKTLDELMLDEKSTREFHSILKKVAETNKPYGPSEWNFIDFQGVEGTVYSTIFSVPSFSGKHEFIRLDVDITDRKRQEVQIHHMAMHDSLTDLPNRRALQEALDGLLGGSDRSKKHALVVMDLDNFKLVNDTLGHLEGDNVLVDVAKALRFAMRPSDLLARVGGDEFAMVIRDVSRSQVKSIAERFFNVISGQPYYLKGYNFQINLSFGISLIDGKSDARMIMASAYSALAEAKYAGKNRIVIYDSKDSGVEFAEASQWGVRINDALRENRFLIHYQPVVSLANRESIYLESLVRMIEGDNEIIYPMSFIPAAERFGLMSKVDRWVVERVIEAVGKKDGFRTFINLSGSSLRDESLLGFIEDSLKKSKIVSNHIGFEITEMTSVTNMDGIRKWMSKLRGLGCRFALDDFGLGYSSFAHLVDLPVDYVKIESSFIQSLDTNPANSAIVKAIASVARLMGKEVIAEGVETESVTKALRMLKIKYGQGNYFKPPSADNTSMTQKINTM